MFLSGLDELDQKILALLVENARYSYSEIGEKLGDSRVAIKNHVDALEKRGVIEGYTTIDVYKRQDFCRQGESGVF